MRSSDIDVAEAMAQDAREIESLKKKLTEADERIDRYKNALAAALVMKQSIRRDHHVWTGDTAFDYCLTCVAVSKFVQYADECR